MTLCQIWEEAEREVGASGVSVCQLGSYSRRGTVCAVTWQGSYPCRAAICVCHGIINTMDEPSFSTVSGVIPSHSNPTMEMPHFRPVWVVFFY
jgi:hypothetical protein